MGFRDAMREAVGLPAKSAFLPQISQQITSLPGLPPIQWVLGLDEAEMWRTQPYLRTVVTFLARNTAQLGLHTFRRVDDTDRVRLTDHPVSKLMSRPNPHMTGFDLIYRLVADKALYDRAYWITIESGDAPSGWEIRPVPPPWITSTVGGDAFGPASYVINRPGASVDKALTVPASQMIVFQGWSPDRLYGGSSPVQALKQILAEQVHAQAYRQQVWERGGRVGAVLTRPVNAPEWSETAQARFSADWQSKWSGRDGPKAGGTPILQDGMQLERVRFSAHEEDYIDAAKLALTLVASVYHINPTMLGLLDNANYSNVREFRRSLYGDSLGPILAEIEDRINAFLVPRIDPEGVYVEFNIGEKLQGSFEEQAKAFQTAVGGPWMLREEARARLNLPKIPDTDELITPLNVTVGGQASPTDSGSQNLDPA